MAKVLVLRTCAADGTSCFGRFRWPESGPVAAPDWQPAPHCGNGLHGLLWGEGNGRLLDWSPTARWQVVAVEESEVVDLKGKVKFPAGEVVHTGSRETAIAYILANGAAGKAVVGAILTAGHRGTATAGDCGTATAGHRGTATAGDCGTATAGDYGTATAGDCGTATAGDCGTATAGDCGTATAGDYGTATAGDYGTATAGDCGTATAGHRGTLAIRWYDLSTSRHRTAIAYVGEDGILPNTKYRLDDQHRFVPVDVPTPS